LAINSPLFSVSGWNSWLEPAKRGKMVPGARSKFGAPVFEFEVFWKQMYCIEESTCHIAGTFRRPPQCFSAPIVIRRPENCDLLFPLLTPLGTNLLSCELFSFSYRPAQMCIENGASFYMSTAVEVAWLVQNNRHSSTSVRLRLVAFRCL